MGKVVRFLLSATIFYLIVMQYYVQLPTKPQQASKQPVIKLAPTAIQPKKAKVKPDYHIIVARNLFHSKDKDKIIKEELPPPPAKPEPTSLNLTLIGTISGNPNNSRAIIINNATRKQDSYHTGDNILTAMIKEIRRKEITLHFNKKDEILAFKEPTIAQQQVAALPFAQQPSTPPIQLSAPPIVPPVSTHPISEAETNEADALQNELSEQAAAENPPIEEPNP